MLPTTIKTEPAMTEIRGVKRSSRLSLSLLVNLCILGCSLVAGLKLHGNVREEIIYCVPSRELRTDRISVKSRVVFPFVDALIVNVDVSLWLINSSSFHA